MDSILFSISSYSVYSFSLLVVLSFLWGSFVFYKKAIESHFEEVVILDIVVFSAIWSIIFGRLIFFFVNYSVFKDHISRILFLKDYPGFSEWGLVSGMLLGLFLIIRKMKLKYIDLLDLMSLGLLGGLPIFYAGLSLFQFSLKNLIFAIVLGVLFVFFWKAEDDYRTYAWYRNKKTHAKSGFIAGMGGVVFGLKGVISQIIGGLNLFNLFCSIGLIVGGLVLVYIRSGRTIKEDLKIFLKYGRKKQ